MKRLARRDWSPSKRAVYAELEEFRRFADSAYTEFRTRAIVDVLLLLGPLAASAPVTLLLDQPIATLAVVSVSAAYIAEGFNRSRTAVLNLMEARRRLRLEPMRLSTLLASCSELDSTRLREIAIAIEEIMSDIVASR